MTLVDTSVLVDYFRGTRNWQTEWLSANLGRERLGLTDLILGEVLQGGRSEHEAARFDAALAPFELIAGGGPATARQAARHCRQLRRAGYTVRGLVDCWVATVCLQHGYALLHRDHDYDGFESGLGLLVIHPRREND